MLTNPLRDPRDRRLPRVPEPCALVVFGITGDLARKKLLPAVYDLANRGLLPTNFALLGFARRDWGDEDFAELARDAGVDLDDVFRVLEDEGVQKFADSWNELVESVKSELEDKA